MLEPIGRDYLYSELVNPIFTKDGDNVKVKVAVKFLDNQTKATQVSQYELMLHKDRNWKIVGQKKKACSSVLICKPKYIIYTSGKSRLIKYLLLQLIQI